MNFRKWYEELKCYIYFSTKDFEKVFYYFDKYGSRRSLYSTGKKNKNGLEIYEEDIIKLSNGIIKIIRNVAYKNCDEWQLDNNNKNCEVIGNIKENLEIWDES
jgi:hypothetical protein